MSGNITNNQREVLAAKDAVSGTPFKIKGNSSDGSIYVDVNSLTNPLVAAPLVGQSKIASTGVAVNLNGGTSQPLTNGIIISAYSGNAAPIEVGTSGVNNTHDGTGNGYVLGAGASISFAISDTNKLYINGTSGDFVSWAGS